MKKICVRDLWKYFGYRVICGDDESMDREILDFDVNRPGLELSGYFDEPSHRIIILGEKEINYIRKMNAESQRRVFDFLTQDNFPMILISRDLPCPQLLYEVAYKKNFPVFSSYAHTNSLIVEMITYLEEEMAETESVHGILLQVYGRGILITGDSGVGKSEIALDLIKRGHILVADDRVDVYRAHNKIFGEAPEILRNKLEIRGVGIIDVEQMYGFTSTMDKAEITCVIELERQEAGNEYVRTGYHPEQVETIFGVDIPKMIIPVGSGRSIATVIESAIANMIMLQKGIDSYDDFRRKQIEFIRRQKESE